jgi:hypothetical protein
MITRSLAQYKDKQTGERRLLFKSTKGNNPKPITVPESLVPILEKHRQQQNQLKQQLGAAYQDNDLIFCQENGAPCGRTRSRSASVSYLCQRLALGGHPKPTIEGHFKTDQYKGIARDVDLDARANTLGQHEQCS